MPDFCGHPVRTGNRLHQCVVLHGLVEVQGRQRRHRGTVLHRLPEIVYANIVAEHLACAIVLALDERRTACPKKAM